MFANVCGIGGSPAGLNPDVAADAPAELPQRLQKCSYAGLILRIVRGKWQEQADVADSLLLRTRRKRPRSRPTDKRDELAPPHVATPYARLKA